MTKLLAAAASLLALAGCTMAGQATNPQSVPAAPAAPAGPAAAPAGMQYLYGSGEGSAMAMTAMHALIAYASDRAAHRPADSVVLAAGSALTKASWVPCAAKPLAVVFDADETLIWNLGFEARAAMGEAYDQARWDRYEQTGARAVAAVPGAVHVVDDLRKLGVTPVINTNRTAASAVATAAALKGAGLGDFVPGETLFLRTEGSGKDARRAAIAARYCVIAMAGDQLGDFSDLFNTLPPPARRELAQHSSAAGKWGKGWFLLPNPVYGTALKGGVDDIFPADKRWADPAEETKP